MCCIDTWCIFRVFSSSLIGDGTTIRTICQDDFHGTKWCLVRIWKPRTKTPLLGSDVSGSGPADFVIKSGGNKLSHPKTSGFLPLFVWTHVCLLTQNIQLNRKDKSFRTLEPRLAVTVPMIPYSISTYCMSVVHNGWSFFSACGPE